MIKLTLFLPLGFFSNQSKISFDMHNTFSVPLIAGTRRLGVKLGHIVHNIKVMNSQGYQQICHGAPIEKV